LEVNEAILCLKKGAPNPERSRKIRIRSFDLPFGHIKNTFKHLLHIRLRMGLHVTRGADVRGQLILQKIKEANPRSNPTILR
jgi:hypothetical protein